MSTPKPPANHRIIPDAWLETNPLPESGLVFDRANPKLGWRPSMYHGCMVPKNPDRIYAEPFCPDCAGEPCDKHEPVESVFPGSTPRTGSIADCILPGQEGLNVQPSEPAQEHNPDNLTPEQYGAPEWRLLRVGERIQPGDQYGPFPAKLGEEWETVSATGGLRGCLVEGHCTIRRRVTAEPTPAAPPDLKNPTDAQLEKVVRAVMNEPTRPEGCTCDHERIGSRSNCPVHSPFKDEPAPAPVDERLGLSDSETVHLRARIAELERENKTLRAKLQIAEPALWSIGEVEKNMHGEGPATEAMEAMSKL